MPTNLDPYDTRTRTHSFHLQSELWPEHMALPGTPMIVIKILIWPHGDASKERSLGTVAIINDGTGTHHCGNYTVKVWGRGPRPRFLKGRKCGIVGFPRRSLTVFHLLRRVLTAAGY